VVLIGGGASSQEEMACRLFCEKAVLSIPSESKSESVMALGVD
jgi:hypothetical protein